MLIECLINGLVEENGTILMLWAIFARLDTCQAAWHVQQPFDANGVWRITTLQKTNRSMKKIILPLIVSVLSMATFAQAKKAAPVKKPAAAKSATAAKPAAPKPATQQGLKNALDSFSYAVGLSIANFYKEQGVQEINQNLVVKALNDVKVGKPQLDEATINNCIVGYMQQIRSDRASGTRKEGEAFLASNKSNPGVVTLPSGLQYKVIAEGTGDKPQITDRVKVHYHGTLIDGTIFDSSVQRGEPIELNVNGVIAGWTEALQLMSVGSKWMLYIPSALGYGDNPAGAIKPGSTLLFEVELLDIVK